MAHQYKLTKNLQHAIEAFMAAREEFEGSLDYLQTALTDEVTEHRDAYGDASERWLESDRAGEVDTWIEEIERAVDDLENIGSLLADFDPTSLEERP